MSRFRAAGMSIAVCAVISFANVLDAQETPASKSKSPAVVKDSDVSDFLREINLSKNADEALLSLRFFSARELTARQRERVDNQIARFQEILFQDQVRFAGKWASREEARQAAEKADQLISQALEKLKNGDGKGTLTDLEKASKANPDGIRAYFILGMLFSIRGNCNPYRAEDYFAEAVKRAPDNVPALNNLAICEIKTRKFGDAYAHFRRAATIAPDSPEVLQNVNRVVLEAQQNQLPVPDGKKNVKKTTTRLDLFEKLAAELNAGAEKKKLKFNPKVGWLFTPYVPTAQERDAAPKEEPMPSPPEQRPLVLAGSGTGFAIAPDVLVTNRHVVKDGQFGLADALTVELPGAEATLPKSAATVLAVSATDDLALLKVDGGNFPPIPLSRQPLKRGREILVLGYPLTNVFGSSLKTTRGVITALEDPRFEGMIMMDAEANPGNSGGPVCDRSGSLIGVLTAKSNAKLGRYTFAVAGGKVQELSAQHSVSLPMMEAAPDAGDWSEIDERLSPSVLLIQTYYRSTPLNIRDRLPETIRPQRSEFEDNSCSWCSGRAAVRCPAAGCIGGARPVTELYTVTLNVGNIRTEGAVSGVVKQYKCSTCSGRGYVSCPLCNGRGTDPDLR